MEHDAQRVSFANQSHYSAANTLTQRLISCTICLFYCTSWKCNCYDVQRRLRAPILGIVRSRAGNREFSHHTEDA